MFNNTTNEHKQILDFVKGFGDEVIWLRPKTTFVQTLQQYGYPLVSKEQAQRIDEYRNRKSDELRDIRLNGKEYTNKKTGIAYRNGNISEKWKYLLDTDVKITSKCCDILKKNPVKAFERERKLFPIIGVMADESRFRTQYMKGGGCNTFDIKRPISKPLSIWTEQDVWDCIEKFNIPYSEIYKDQIIDGKKVKGEERTGCAYCAFGVQFDEPGDTKFDRLFIREPKRYKGMMDKLGYRGALHAVGVKLPDDPSKDSE